jgi:hypothetical protein
VNTSGLGNINGFHLQNIGAEIPIMEKLKPKRLLKRAPISRGKSGALCRTFIYSHSKK